MFLSVSVSELSQAASNEMAIFLSFSSFSTQYIGKSRSLGLAALMAAEFLLICPNKIMQKIELR